MSDQNANQPQGEAIPTPEGVDSNTNKEVGESQPTPVERPSAPITPEKPSVESQTGPGVQVPDQNTVNTTPNASVQNVPVQTPREDQNPNVDTGNPVEAKDAEMIEKKWVDKAEDVIKKDKGKPYFEEKDHEDLQIDYMKKRFGKDIKKSEE